MGFLINKLHRCAGSRIPTAGFQVVLLDPSGYIGGNAGI
jgi:hypothetical protein